MCFGETFLLIMRYGFKINNMEYFNAVVFFSDGSVKKWRTVREVNFYIFLNRVHPGWRYVNFYSKKSKLYVKRVYKHLI